MTAQLWDVEVEMVDQTVTGVMAMVVVLAMVAGLAGGQIPGQVLVAPSEDPLTHVETGRTAGGRPARTGVFVAASPSRLRWRPLPGRRLKIRTTFQRLRTVLVVGPAWSV